MFLYADDGELYEVPDTDCELDSGADGFWLLAAEDEDHEDFYAFVDVEDDGDDADGEDDAAE